MEARILEYPDLPPAQQQEVDEYVASHPEWSKLLEDVRALDALSTSVREGEPREAPEDADLPEGDRLARRLRQLEDENEPAAAQFTTLTGRTVPLKSASPQTAAAAPSERAPEPASRHDRSTRRWLRYVGAVVLALALLYGALATVSWLSQSKNERLANIQDERLNVEGYGRRGMNSPGTEAARDSTSISIADLDERYLHALGELREARQTTLGLFPRYDQTQLQHASCELKAIAKESGTRSFLQLEALFFLGKAQLAQDDLESATKTLRRVVIGQGRMAPQAQSLLTELHAEAAYDGPPEG